MDETLFAWTVPADHPAFAGHFPGRPIVPGVTLLDHALRCAAQWTGNDTAGWRIANAKFLRPAGPGDALEFLLRRRADGSIDFRIRGAAADVASGNLSPIP